MDYKNRWRRNRAMVTAMCERSNDENYSGCGNRMIIFSNDNHDPIFHIYNYQFDENDAVLSELSCDTLLSSEKDAENMICDKNYQLGLFVTNAPELM